MSDESLTRRGFLETGGVAVGLSVLPLVPLVAGCAGRRSVADSDSGGDSTGDTIQPTDLF